MNYPSCVMLHLLPVAVNAQPIGYRRTQQGLPRNMQKGAHAIMTRAPYESKTFSFCTGAPHRQIDVAPKTHIGKIPAY